MAKKSADGASSPQYSPRDYIIPGSDHHGHGVRKQFRCSPAMANEITKIVQARKWPWSTDGDMMRWAVWEGIKKCERMEEVPNSMYAIAQNMIETSRMALMVVTFKQSLDEAEKTVRELQAIGMEKEALRHLSDLRDQAAKVAEPMWREKYLEEFERRFSHMWRAAKGERSVAKMTGMRG
jgi:hypothetical protein